MFRKTTVKVSAEHGLESFYRPEWNVVFFFLFYSSFSAAKGSLLQSLCGLLRRPSSPSIPGPPGRFLIGNMAELMQDHLPIHLTDLAKRYGNIYRLKCGNTSN